MVRTPGWKAGAGGRAGQSGASRFAARSPAPGRWQQQTPDCVREAVTRSWTQSPCLIRVYLITHLRIFFYFFSITVGLFCFMSHVSPKPSGITGAPVAGDWIVGSYAGVAAGRRPVRKGWSWGARAARGYRVPALPSPSASCLPRRKQPCSAAPLPCCPPGGQLPELRAETNLAFQCSP